MQEVTRLFELFRWQAEHLNQEIALAGREGQEWQTLNSLEVAEQIDLVSKGLVAMGLETGDRVAIISNNRPAWNIVDLGNLQAGGITVPVYPTISDEEFRFILKHAGVRFAFVSDRKLNKKIEAIRPQLPDLEAVFTFDTVKGAKSWTAVMQTGNKSHVQEVQARAEAIDTEDLATIIYTSGTTGIPKGVMLSHKNLLHNIRAVDEVLPICDRHRVISFLPLSHIFERMVTYHYFYVGASVYYAANMVQLPNDLLDVKPHYFTAVPRILEKVHERFFSQGEKLGGISRQLFDWAVDLANQYDPDGSNNPLVSVQLALARKLVFSKWREKLGGEIEGIVTGAAALPEYLYRFYMAAGIELREGYGQSETSPVISTNRFSEDNYRGGTVGIPLPGVEIMLTDQNEICVQGDNVMMGYYKDPEQTARTIDEDGWLHTGDQGAFIEGKFLKITGRIKELFKNSGGKYIAPQHIESALMESSLVDQALVFGENQKYVAALIVPNFEALEAFAQTEGINFENPEELVSHPDIKAHFKSIVNEKNKRLADFERVKQFVLLQAPWSVEDGELTPTLKPRRKVIADRYEHEIGRLFPTPVN